MSQDGRLQRISRKITNDRPITNEIDCDCGGTIYRAARNKYASCTGGEVRCTDCGREAKRFGRSGWTCGAGCIPKAHHKPVSKS